MNNLSYKQCKKLKELGLSQEYGWGGWICEHGIDTDPKRKNFCKCSGDELIRCFTLEELIEEVEKLQYPIPDIGKMDTFRLEHDVTSERGRHWFAEYKIKVHVVAEEFNENDFKEEVFRCGGDSPIEAVYNLYVALKEK